LVAGERNAGQAFFLVDRPSYRVHAVVDGWQRVLAWFEKYLKSPSEQD
jgi:carboxymethylenebutenolidase